MNFGVNPNLNLKSIDMAKLTREEKVNKIAACIAEGGWSSIHSLVNDLSNRQIEDYNYLWDETEEEEEDE